MPPPPPSRGTSYFVVMLLLHFIFFWPSTLARDNATAVNKTEPTDGFFNEQIASRLDAMQRYYLGIKPWIIEATPRQSPSTQPSDFTSLIIHAYYPRTEEVLETQYWLTSPGWSEVHWSKMPLDKIQTWSWGSVRKTLKEALEILTQQTSGSFFRVRLMQFRKQQIWKGPVDQPYYCFQYDDVPFHAWFVGATLGDLYRWPPISGTNNTVNTTSPVDPNHEGFLVSREI